MIKPLVDINIAVYNQAPYLRQTLTSVLNQKTNFPYRLIIGDDCSTDGSREILKEYEQKFPDKILLILQEKNLGLNHPERNGIVIMKRSTAKYISLLDGDDYWTDDLKLQKQIEFLEANPEYASCFHNTTELVEEDPSKSFLYCSFDQADYVTTDRLLNDGNLVPTCSNVYRRELVPDLPPWVRKLAMGDWPINIMLSQKGKIRYMDANMGVHRIHGMGTWSKISAIHKEQAVLRAYEAFSKHLELTDAEKEIVNRKISGLIAAIVAAQASGVGKLVGLKFLLGSIFAHPGLLFTKDFLRCGKILLS
jgi:glycosyltransferase involved in cell wall biosynthesis